MTSFSDHQSNLYVKLLLIGDSKIGKTALLGSLANAGYRLFILDYDNGLDVLKSYVRPENRKNIFFKTIIDKINSAQGTVSGVPAMLTETISVLNDWKETDPADPTKFVSMGSAYKWGEMDVLVGDSLTLFGNGCMRHALALNGRLGQRPTQGDWGDAIRYQENFLELLYAPAIKCNVVLTAHVNWQEGDSGIMQGYPSALGNKLGPRVARYFNSLLLVQSKPTPGGGTSRILRTQPTANITLGTPLADIPAEIPFDLATYFAAVKRGRWATS